MSGNDGLDLLIEASELPVWRLRDYRGALRADAVLGGVAETQQASPPEVTTRAAESGAGPRPRPDPDAQQEPVAGPPNSTRSERVTAADDADGAWSALETEIRACQACSLCRQRKQAVPGVGDRQADWLFIGEGPGAEEDERGEPFVGQAGRLLDAMLASIGLERGRGVYIANAVKCRPPGNRTPDAAEIAACKGFLDRQIALVQPKIIVLLGRAAAQAVLGKDDTLSSLRGHTLDRAGVPVVATYHPAYLLRTPLDKAKSWEDLCRARAIVRGG